MTPYHRDGDGDDATGSAYALDDSDDAEDLITLDNFDDERTTAPIFTSPRSIEACRMQGIEPQDLVKRPLEYFFTHSVHTRTPALADDLALVEKRAARYEKNRQLQLRSARAQRQELIDAGLHGVHGGMSLKTRSFCRSPIGAKLSMSRHDAASSSAQQAFTVIEREKKELKRMQQRQAAEVQQMLQFELKMAELHAERERAEREKKRQDELLVRDRTRRQRESDELKRRRELERAEEHKRELELARREAQEKQAEAMRREQRLRQEEERRRRDAQRAELERQRRQEEQRAQTELVQLAQIRDVEQKEREIARRDARRRQQLEATKRLKALEVAEKQQRNKLRITSVLTDSALRQTLQQQDAARKQALSDARRDQFEAERLAREAELRLQAQRKREAIDMVQQQLELQETQRRERLLQLERDAAQRLAMQELEKHRERERQKRDEQRAEDERRQAYVRMETQLQLKQAAVRAKADEKAIATQRMLAHKRQSMRARLHDAQLREEEIQAALARKHKADAYKTELLLSRIESDNARTRELKAQRERLVRRRQQIKQRASREKQEILDSFYRMKVTKKFELPAHLAASVASMRATTRPQSASVLQTRSLTDCDGESSGYVAKASVKRPASAIGRPRTATGTIDRDRPPLHRRYSDADVLDADEDEEDDALAQEAATNHQLLDDAVIRAEIDALRRKHNAELLKVLEEEHHAEEQREHLEHQARDSAERERIETIFSKERALASERIMLLTQRHERALAARISELEQR